MKEVDEDDKLIRRFLLGDVREEERQRVEESLITDKVYSDNVSMAENDLIEDYLEDALPETEREQFNAHFLSAPRQRRKVRIADALPKVAAVEQAARSPAGGQESSRSQPGQRKYYKALILRKPLVSLSLTAMLLVALGLGAWKIVETRRESERLKQAQASRSAIEQELARLNVPAGGVPGHGTPPADARIYSVDLAPVLVRSGDNSSMVSPPAQATVMELRLVLIGEEYGSYRVSLQKFDSADQFSISGLRAEITTGGKAVPVKIPTRLLTRGVYQLKLSGDTAAGATVEAGEYKFQVTNQATR